MSSQADFISFWQSCLNIRPEPKTPRRICVVGPCPKCGHERPLRYLGSCRSCYDKERNKKVKVSRLVSLESLRNI